MDNFTLLQTNKMYVFLFYILYQMSPVGLSEILYAKKDGLGLRNALEL